jgi:dTDP-4-dehydrorhamnose 3,5-epimerase-like enzyme
MPMRSREHAKFITKDAAGEANGWLVPIVNVHDDFPDAAQWPKQVYLTVVAPGKVKGPHLHLKRWGLFTCIAGNVKIVTRAADGTYEETFSGVDHGFRTVHVPAGVPAALQNSGESEAYVLNMPSPSWHVDDQDEHEVTFEGYSFAYERD